MQKLERLRISEWSVLLLLTFSILWKGGKGLEATWMLAGITSILTIVYWWKATTLLFRRPRVNAKSIRLPQSKGHLPIFLWISVLLFLGWSWISFLFSETKNYGLDELLRESGYAFLFLWIAHEHIENRNSWFCRKVPSVVAIVATIAAVIGAFIYVLQPVNRFVGTFFDWRFHTDYWPNAWAEFVLAAWPLLFIVAWKQDYLARRTIAYSFLGILFGTLFLSYSRGAILAFIGQSALLLTLISSIALRDIRYRRKFHSLLKNIFLKSMGVLLLAIAIFFVMNSVRSTVFEVQSVTRRITFSSSDGTSSIDERASFWKHAWLLALEKPLLGWGPYSFRFTQTRYMDSVLATSDHPHNILLKLAAERGFPAAILFASIIMYVFVTSILSLFTKRKAFEPLQDVQTMAYITAVAGLLLHNMIDYNTQFTAVGILGVIALGFLVHPVPPQSNTENVSYSRWRIRRIFARLYILLACFVLLITVLEGYGLLVSSFGRHAEARGESSIALSWYDRSSGAMLSRDLFLSIAELSMRSGFSTKAKTALDRYRSLNDEDYRLWRLSGEWALRRGNLQDAIRTLEKAYIKGKYADIGVFRLLLGALRKEGKIERIHERKFEFDSLFSKYADAIEHNVHFIDVSHAPEELMITARILGMLFPLDANRYEAIAQKAMSHAKEERKRYTARSPGILW